MFPMPVGRIYPKITRDDIDSTIEEINKSPHILPNTYLGCDMYSTI